MFLLTNKALILVGKGEKRKAPESSRLGAIRERFGTRVVHQESADQASQNGTKAEFLLQE
jgi:hypothetical protein